MHIATCNVYALLFHPLYSYLLHDYDDDDNGDLAITITQLFLRNRRAKNETAYLEKRGKNLQFFSKQQVAF